MFSMVNEQGAAAARRSGLGDCVPVLDGVFDGSVQRSLKLHQFDRAGGAEIDGGGGAFGNGIDAGASVDGTQVQSGAGLGGQRCLGQDGKCGGEAAMGLGVPASVKL